FSGGRRLANRPEEHEPSPDQAVLARTRRLANRSFYATCYLFGVVFLPQRAPSTLTTSRWLTVSGDIALGPATSHQEESTGANRWRLASGNASAATPSAGCSRRGMAKRVSGP